MTKKRIALFIICICILFIVSCLSKDNTSTVDFISTLPISSIAVTSTQTLHPSLATNIAFEATLDSSISATNTVRGVTCPELYQLSYPRRISSNSNDNWTVFTCSIGKVNLAQEQEEVIFDTYVKSIDGKETWIISHESSIWENQKSIQLTTYSWSRDGKYLYLTPILETGGSGIYTPGYFWDNYSFYRLDLTNGKIQNLLSYKGKKFLTGYSFSLSPSEQYLAYSEFGNKLVHIRDLYSGEEILFDIEGDYLLSGIFVWHNNSSSLVFASAMNGWEDGNDGISIYKISIKDLRLERILSRDKRLLIPYLEYETNNYWVNENLLYVTSLNYLSYEYFSKLVLDVKTGSVDILATPEPHLIGSPTPKP